MHRDHNRRFSIHKGRRPLALDIPPTSVPCLLSPLHTTVALDTPTLYLALRKDYKAPTSEIMLHLSLARDEYARQASRHVFDPSYSPDHSECSYSSQKYARSRSPSPIRHSNPSPVRRMPRSNTVSHPRSATHHTLPRSHTHPSDLSSVAQSHIFRRPSRSGNEEVLRSRLEGVLSSAPGSRDVSCPPSPTRRRGESFGLITPPHGHLPAMTRSATSPAISRAPPITPPPSPPFDANQVALQLRDREGYVSFADVQGLGMPSDEDEDTCDAERGRARWWSIFKA